MKYPSLVNYLAIKTGNTYENVDGILKEFIEVTKHEVLENHKEVRLPYFGKFWPRIIKGRNERKIGGISVMIPSQTKVAFKAFQKAGKEEE